MNKNLFFIFFIIALLSSCTSDSPDGDTGRGTPGSYRIVITLLPKDQMKISLAISADEANREHVWVDLNQNGKKDNGEQVTDFEEEENIASATSMYDRERKVPYTPSSSIVTIYGKISGLNCTGNNITQLDVSQNRLLKYLSCADNPLTVVDVEKNSGLKVLNCGSTDIQHLNVTQNKKLERLDCHLCELKMLDVTRNKDLILLDCWGNELVVLNLSQNKKLHELDCSDNKLSHIDISQCQKLLTIDCSENYLMSLNMSHNKLIYFVNCSLNNISGKRMDALIESLPKHEKKGWTHLCVINQNGADGRPDMNKCTKQQVAKARSKHWEVFATKGDRDIKYDGS